MKGFISNSDDNIYSISGFTEEIIAVLFAYVSRSPKSFRDNIDEVTAEKARKFHEKWVINYGHGSVAEHAVIHLGLEKVSRLFTSELALSNKFISITEYSQRYQEPRPGDFYTPIKVRNAEFYSTYHEELYSIYRELIGAGCHKEDARHILPISTFSSMGITCNSRALRDSIAILSKSSYSETRYNSRKMMREGARICPTLVKERMTEDKLEYRDSRIFYDNEIRCLDRKSSKYFDSSYTFSFGISETCFHQLLRHRTFDLIYSKPEHNYSIVHTLFNEKHLKIANKAVDYIQSKEVQEWLRKEHKEVVDYTVLNCSVRKVICNVTGKGFDNFFRLRTKEKSQAEIQRLARGMMECLKEI